jgi:L-2-hydroxycarboxylate dehydrogenase (NAD+)
MSAVKLVDPAFLSFALQRVCEAAGMTAIHASYVADAIVFAHLQGKLNQGLGVYEALDIALQAGVFDVQATPECINEGPAYSVFDGNRSSGYYTLNLMAESAIAKAASSGIAISFGGNHNDAGSFGRYVYLAHERGMMAFSSNNTVPLAAPWGAMQNRLSCPPFDAIGPSGEEMPVWISTKFAEWYDADISEAALAQKPLKGHWLIDPESGDLSDDASHYAKPIDGYGRVWDCEAAGQLGEPRTYALNLWNELLSAIINPVGVPVTELPTIADYEAGNAAPSVGGSYYIAIDPSVFGPMAAVLKKSDQFVRDVRSAPPRPGHSVRLPSQRAYDNLMGVAHQVPVMTAHWEAFFNTIASRYHLSEESLRQAFDQQLEVGV